MTSDLDIYRTANEEIQREPREGEAVNYPSSLSG